MTITPLQFRLLLAVSIITGLIGGFFDLLFPSAIPEAITKAIESIDNEPTMPMLIADIVVVIALIVGLVASTIGLYLFRSWSPRLAILITLLAWAVDIALGPTVSSGWATVIVEISTTTWGALLALAYFSPIKEMFSRGVR